MCYITASGYKQELNRGVYPWGDCIKMRSPEYKERGETVEPDEGAAGGEGVV